MNKTLLGMVIIGVSATPVMAAEFTCQLENKKYVSLIVDPGKHHNIDTELWLSQR